MFVRLPKLEDLKEQVYEIDTDIEQGDMVSHSCAIFHIII